jgi:hypothetical protein
MEPYPRARSLASPSRAEAEARRGRPAGWVVRVRGRT